MKNMNKKPKAFMSVRVRNGMMVENVKGVRGQCTNRISYLLIKMYGNDRKWEFIWFIENTCFLFRISFNILCSGVTHWTVFIAYSHWMRTNSYAFSQFSIREHKCIFTDLLWKSTAVGFRIYYYFFQLLISLRHILLVPDNEEKETNNLRSNVNNEFMHWVR